MLRLDKVIKPWKESAALNAHITSRLLRMRRLSLPKAGRGNDSQYSGCPITKVSTVLNQEYAVKRLEAALKALAQASMVYQYLFKSNRPDIPFATYD